MQKVLKDEPVEKFDDIDVPQTLAGATKTTSPAETPSTTQTTVPPGETTQGAVASGNGAAGPPPTDTSPVYTSG
jgi:hypothetical protein